MNLQYDRQITISTGESRKDMHWKPQHIRIGELWEKLKEPRRSDETTGQYFAMKKAQQDDLKDVGGFVGGSLSGGRRKAAAVTGRDLITLDFDTIPPYETDRVLQTVAALGCAYAVYSTRKHIETAPRLRILFPTDRTVTPDEYEPIARWMASQIGIQMADPTTFEASRLMYWPSCCRDGAYLFKYEDAPLLSADGVLGCYTDWRDWNSWPQVPGATTSYKQLAAKQGDPMTKPGIVGAFNRICGNVIDAMEKLLPGVYEPVAGDPNRFTFVGGSTTGGAVVYDDGKFLYSHHATDPCSGKLVNCFDLVRLHKFSELDDRASPDTPNNRLPSYKAMCEFAATVPGVAEDLNAARQAEAAKDFAEALQNDIKPPVSYFHKMSAQGVPSDILDSRIEEYIIQKNHIFLLDGKLYLYEDGFYRMDRDGRRVKALIRECIVPELVMSNKLDRVYKLFLSDERLAIVEENINDYPDYWINFKNGMLDVKTGVMHPHDPKYRSLNQIPHEYDPTAVYEGSMADRFFRGLLPDDEDRKMVLTFAGLCMTRDMHFQKFLVLLGEGSIGKSTACNLIKDMIGNMNKSDVPLQRLNERFQSVPLMHKLINISTDLPATSMSETSIIRMITGEDSVPAEFKGGDSFGFDNYARLLFSANELPSVQNETPAAFFRRLLVAECVKGEYIEGLHRLNECIPAFITECVRQLQARYILGTEMDSPRSKSAVDMYLQESDSAIAFIEECTVRDINGRIPQTELHERYRLFCEVRHWTPKSNRNFYSSVRSLGYRSSASNGKDWFYGISYKQ